jgi:hypothetical protein
VVTFAADDTALMVGQPWRLYADGLEAAGEYVVPARPQTTPGTASVPILLVDESTVTVTVVTAAPGGGGAGLSDDNPAALGTTGPGVATEAARIDHVHPVPSAAAVGADPAGSAATAQAAAISAAATDATTKANAAQAAAISTASTDATTKANAAQAAAITAAATDATTKANTAESDAATYTDSAVDALDEVADGDGIAIRRSGGFVYHDRVGKLGAAGSPVASTTSPTAMLAAALSYPANTFGLATHLIRVRFAGKILQNQAATQSMTIRVQVAGQTLFEFPWTSIPQSATARNFRGECSFGFNTFAGTRAFGAGQSSLGAAGAGLAFGTQVVDASIAATFDLATAITFDLTAQPGASASTLTASLTQYAVDITRTP